MNVARINLLVDKCIDCPYCRKPQGCVEYFCAHDLKHNLGVCVGDGGRIPDFCPLVLGELERVLEVIDGGSDGSVPKKYLSEIERKQKRAIDVKLAANHAFRHVKVVTKNGLDFLDQCAECGLTDPDKIQKEKVLFRIAAYFHDIGLADSLLNHAVHSAEIAKKYLTKAKKFDINIDDVNTIVHAIANHSDGRETETMVDAALILADKLDVTKDRIIRAADSITTECLKINSVRYTILEGKSLKGAELRYYVDEGFRRSILKEWPKCVAIPRMITKNFLHLPEFHFYINDEEVDVSTVCN